MIQEDERTEPLKEKLIEFLLDNPKELQEIYEEFKDEKPTTIRGRLNENVGNVFKRIGRGIYLADNGKAKALVIEGDCWEKIKDVDNESIDTIITDSPYTCLDAYYKIGTTRQRNVNKSIGFQTKDIDTTLLKEMLRVLKPNGHFFSFMPASNKDTYEYNKRFIEMSQQTGFTFNKIWIWDKQVIGMGYNGRNRYEQIVFLSKGDRRKPYDLSIADVLSHKRIASSHRIHEAEKPIELIKDIMKFSCKENDTVLDTFAGSMVVAQAGMELNINTISFEIEEEIIKRAITIKFGGIEEDE